MEDTMRKRLIASFTALLATACLAAGPEACPIAPGPCDTPCCTCTDACPCGGSPFWASAEYLLWWVKDGPLPVTVVGTGSTADLLPGALNQPGSRSVYGPTALNYGTFSGLRIGAGYWLDGDQTFGVEARGFLLEQKERNFTAASDAAGNPVLTLPILNTVTGLGERYTIADPSLRSGRIDTLSSTRLWGAEANGAVSLFRGESLRAVGLVGFRYLDLMERFETSINSTALAVGPGHNDVIFNDTAFHAPFGVQVSDSFHTRNQFYGGQVGSRADYTLGPIFTSAAVRVGLGDTHEVLDNAGISTLTTNGVPAVSLANGRLVGSASSGRHISDHFSVVPEVEVKAGCQIIGGLKAFVGYNFLYWSGVVRPGSEISTVVDTRPFPTSVIYQPGAVPTAPLLSFHRSDFWAQGVNFGLQLDF
jgi:hypothetical protein